MFYWQWLWGGAKRDSSSLSFGQAVSFKTTYQTCKIIYEECPIMTFKKLRVIEISFHNKPTSKELFKCKLLFLTQKAIKCSWYKDFK